MYGMFLNFAALAGLPLVDASAISFAAPFITVAFGAWFLGERVRIYRRSAVAVGIVGIIVMLWPHPQSCATCFRRLRDRRSDIGVACGMLAAFTNGGSVVQTRH